MRVKKYQMKKFSRKSVNMKFKEQNLTIFTESSINYIIDWETKCEGMETKNSKVK